MMICNVPIVSQFRQGRMDKYCNSNVFANVKLLISFIFKATDIFAACLFYFEGLFYQSLLTILFVLLPGFCIAITELRRNFCSKPLSLIKAVGYLLLSPLWAIIIHFYSLCDERYAQSALFYKTLEGFIEAGPQFALQFSLLLRGHWSKSSNFVINPVIPKHFQVQDETSTEMITTTLLPSLIEMETTTESATNNLSLTIFDRYYDEGKSALRVL